MISLIKTLPDFKVINAELLKIKCLYDAYKNDSKVLFWSQDGDRAVVAMTDGNMIIYNSSADLEELSEFVNVMSPACVFSDYDTLCGIGKKPLERINIMCRNADIKEQIPSDCLSSRGIYELLDVDGLSLPEYPYFAVDYCRRLNHGGADFFALRGKCAVITFCSGKNAIINGIASHEKGFGSVALRGIMAKNCGRKLFVCCRDNVKEFYQKNGFEMLYYGGYWIKEIWNLRNKNEHN